MVHMKNNNKSKIYDILCVGACVQDILIEGMNKESFAEPVTVLKKVTFTSGGDATNEAIILSRLGNSTALAAKIDKGAAGNSIYAELQKEDVDTSYMVQDKNSQSTSTFVVIGKDGKHNFFLAKGKNEGIALDDINVSILQKTRAVCIGSLYTSYRLDRGGAANLMSLAQKSGVITFADMDHDVEGLGPNAMDTVYPYVDYLMPSIEEARYVTGESTPEKSAEVLRSKGAKTVVLKLGSEGCFVQNEREAFYVDPYIVTPKDTTGCGDNFVAGFIHSILEEKTLLESAKFACAAGALNSLEIGGHTVIRSRQQVVEFMKHTVQNHIIRK